MPPSVSPLGFPLDEIRNEAFENIELASNSVHRMLCTFRVELWETTGLDECLCQLHAIRMRLAQIKRPNVTIEDATLFRPPTRPQPPSPNPPQIDP